ncbi:tRNA threonylcarbamoyladenosine dehydratase [Hathewaya limosa]|uniref:tRNA A37 threonylcarbamoyladenosine dehydratase n=1 Tax=Hathewaya limosa TaxID=1536 RepID=A0ABU0JN53_HATLI|nr:tRNA threonylcarbamoyladenosine dehydratase [Hathewaya limosa]AWZ49211.1 tRNA threonylcarbamoyladenosine dehydratase [Clostridiaceae bacterium 14S0207]MDQ0478507.1 tRNA A37 threonylcarbamoyladenosine dehydratase [Hathewaya limosa]
MEQHSLSRTELLIGKNAINDLKNSKVVILGVGGVGGFVTEAIARSGVGTIVLVDKDTVSLTNLNRQIIATHDTIGKVKVDIMKERILSINPECNVITHQCFISKENIEELIQKDVDYVVDAIDTVSSKISVIEYCYKNNINIISSMGTGNKMDPTQFKITTLNKTKVCPLAKVMRHELKKRGIEKVKVLYSEEIPLKPQILEGAELKGNRQAPGSMPFVPPVAGMIIGGEVIKDIIANKANK